MKDVFLNLNFEQIKLISKSYNSIVSGVCDEMKINPIHFKILECFADNKDQVLTLSEVSNRCNMNISTLSRTIRTVVKQGFLKVSNDLEDKRLVYFSLTKSGIISLSKFENNVILMLQEKDQVA